MFFSRKKPAEPVKPVQAQGGATFFSTHAFDRSGFSVSVTDVMKSLIDKLPRVITGAMDSADNSSSLKMASMAGSFPEVLAMWYASQGFIGHQLCAILAQNWLISKACTMPARDAIRRGFDVVTVDGDAVDAEVIKKLRRVDKAMRLTWNLEQFVRMGRIFGIRIAFFKVDSTDPDYYEKPFNIDGVTPGSYKGIVQVDPYWTAPWLDGNAAARPDTMRFYEPTYWTISGKKYHRSHLIIFRNCEVPDLLKPSYQYGGVPVPQQIMERVYAAERVANEAPQLAQTKRTNVWKTDLEKVMANEADTVERLNTWIQYRDNYGVKLGDKEGDEFQQFDTSLADLDSVIMTQYQIVAAAANVPATKLLGTSPKGFNATGEFEEASYHEELESIQAHDLTPFLERHYALVAKSEKINLELTANWKPLDSPTAKELAETNLIKAQIGAALVNSGAISSEEERERIAVDPESGYAAIDLSAPPPVDDLDEDEILGNLTQGRPDDQSEREAQG